MSKIVIIDFYASLCSNLGEQISWTNKEIVTNYLSYKLLVQISIVHMFPISILQQEYKNIINLFTYTYKRSTKFKFTYSKKLNVKNLYNYVTKTTTIRSNSNIFKNVCSIFDIVISVRVHK